MIIEFVVNVPFATQLNLDDAKEYWLRYFNKTKRSVGIFYKFSRRNVLYERDDLPNERFFWHIKIDDSKVRYLRRFVRNIAISNATAVETFNNSVSYKRIKKVSGASNEEMVIAKHKLGGYINNYCSNEEYMNDLFPKEKKAECSILDDAVYEEEIEKAKRLDHETEISEDTKVTMIEKLKSKMKNFNFKNKDEE